MLYKATEVLSQRCYDLGPLASIVTLILLKKNIFADFLWLLGYR